MIFDGKPSIVTLPLENVPLTLTFDPMTLKPNKYVYVYVFA